MTAITILSIILGSRLLGGILVVLWMSNHNIPSTPKKTSATVIIKKLSPRDGHKDYSHLIEGRIFNNKGNGKFGFAKEKDFDRFNKEKPGYLGMYNFENHFFTFFTSATEFKTEDV